MSKLRLKRVHEAIEDFKKAESYDDRGENPAIADGLGQCYCMLQDYP